MKVTMSEDFLMHYGVPGMKWGVRKPLYDKVNTTNGKTGSGSGVIKNIIGTVIAAHDNEKKKLDDKAAAEKLKKEREKNKQDDKNAKNAKSDKQNEKIANEVINGKWDNGEKRRKMLEKAGYSYNDVQYIVNKKLLGKDAADRISKRNKTTSNKDGSKVKIGNSSKKLARSVNKSAKKSVKHDESDGEYLMHYGVLGMKWGVRRQERKAARQTKKAEKFGKKVAEARANQRAAEEDLKEAEREKIRTEAKLNSDKADVLHYSDKVKNPKKRFLLGVNQRQLERDKASLEEAREAAKESLREDAEAESWRSAARLDIQSWDAVAQQFGNKQLKAATKADVARGKAAIKREKLQKAMLEKANRIEVRNKKKEEKANAKAK